MAKPFKYAVNTVHASVNYGNFIILERRPNNRFLIRFLNTGFEKEIDAKSMYHKNIRDNSAKYNGSLKTNVQKGDTYQTQKYGFLEVLEDPVNRHVLVRFMNTGFEKIANCQRIENGTVRDDSVKLPSGFKRKTLTGKSFKIGAKFKCRKGFEFEVIEENKADDVTIRFTNTGTILKTRATAIRSGRVDDCMEPSYSGVGYLGHYKGGCYWTKNTWNGIIARSVSDDYPSAVCERWKCFANFEADIQSIPNYAEWLASKDDKTLTQYQLDKDLLIPGNTIYQPGAVCFVTTKDNSLEARLRKDIKDYEGTPVAEGLKISLDALRSVYTEAMNEEQLEAMNTLLQQSN